MGWKVLAVKVSGLPGLVDCRFRRLGLAEQLAEVEECCCAAERSESWAFFHLAMNSCGVMKIGGYESFALARNGILAEPGRFH